MDDKEQNENPDLGQKKEEQNTVIDRQIIHQSILAGSRTMQ